LATKTDICQSDLRFQSCSRKSHNDGIIINPEGQYGEDNIPDSLHSLSSNVAPSTDDKFFSSESSDDEAYGEQQDNHFSVLLSTPRIDENREKIQGEK
jgi:hypothetical protein